MMRKPKRTIMQVKKDQLHQSQADVLAVGIFQDASRLPSDYTALNKAADGLIGKIIKMGDFKGKANETTVLYSPGKLSCKRIMLLGLGKKDKLELSTLRQAAGTAARTAETLGVVHLDLALHIPVPAKFDLERIGQALAEGAVAGRYDYQDYLPANKEKNATSPLMRVSIIEPKTSAVLKIKRGCKIGQIMAQAQNQTRMVANMPGNELNPPSLARLAQKVSRQTGLKCKVFHDRQLDEMGMNAILAVGAGSASKPRLIRLDYQGRASRANKNPDVVVVGKAITFDSGGISLKPGANMEAMKFDKCGGCAVLGVMSALSSLKFPLHVVGLIPSAENLPSHTSYRPGDIVRTYSGKTVEVQNTDAEGRMILCDALAYAQKMKPGAIIDMATLTGACVIALGTHHAGLFSNNDSLCDQLRQAADRSGDCLWPLPSGPDYLEQMRSKIADLRNIGGREGGSCTAAAFLGEFVGNIPWAHIDIAGVSDTNKSKPYRGVGATGFGVRLVLEYLRGLSKKKG